MSASTSVRQTQSHRERAGKRRDIPATERVKVYILEVKDTPKGPRILVSRTHPGLVKRLFESEVAEVRDGTV